MENIRDVSQYDTKDLPHIKDFKWITSEIQAGELEAQGPGSIRVTDIYAIGDHMYAFGTIGWPDGIKGSLFMVRPEGGRIWQIFAKIAVQN